MNALDRLLNNSHWVAFKPVLVLLFGLSSLPFTTTSVQAAICYADPQQAYNYILAQEKNERQARDQATININRASEGELVSLNGIGSSKAQEIILYREMFGNFKSVDELEQVKGIGIKTIEKNRSRLRIQ